MSEPLYELAQAVAIDLKRNGIGATVTYGSTVFEPQPGRPVIRFSRDRSGGDLWSPVNEGTARAAFTTGVGRSPFGTATVGVLVEVRAASQVSGAGEQEHVDATWQTVLALWPSLIIAAEDARVILGDGRGLYLPISDGDREIGTRYELRFSVRTGVSREDLALADGSIAVAPTVRVFVGGVEQIACGEDNA